MAPRILESALWGVAMLGFFALFMTFGFQLRFGAYPWEML